MLSLLLAVATRVAADGFLGVHEEGSTVSFSYLAADPTTGEPTEPVNVSYKVVLDGATVDSGPMYAAELGIATGTYHSAGAESGMYTLLMSGLIGGVTRQQMRLFSLIEPGAGPESLKAQLTALASAVLDVSRELRIVSHENSRSRLWYAQSVIDTATRKVPADLPSHLEVQIKYDDMPAFTTPEATFYRVFFYPDCATATRACREEKHITPPTDGTFYALPNNSW
jgi:hypothetical protein